AVDPHTSLTWQKGFKVDDFYAARSGTIPPLAWSNIAPPFSHLWEDLCHLVAESSKVQEQKANSSVPENIIPWAAAM
ncbi:MAG: hypothetical protein ACK4S5_00450, partial [Sphingobium yanoikuyae]